MKKKFIYKWPDKLPNPYYRYSYAPVNSFSRTPMQGGVARHRVENELEEMNINVEWKIPFDQMEDFLFFVHKLIGKRSSWGFFELPLIFDEKIKYVLARFCDPNKPYNSVNEGNTQWSVTAKMEVIGLETISESDYWKRNPIKEYVIIDNAVNNLLPEC